jgi:hydrogenase-4 component D
VETAGWQAYAGLILLFPIVGAVFVATQRARRAYLVAIIFAAAALVALVLLADLFLGVGGQGRLVAQWTVLSWLGGRAGDMGFLVDGLTMLMLIVVLVVGLLVVLFSSQYLTPENREHATSDGGGRYCFWLLLFIASMVGLALAPNLLQLFIFWELTTICSWALISHYRGEKSIAAGYKALVLTSVGSLGFVIALLLCYQAAGSFQFAALGLLTPRRMVVVFLLLLVAAWAKAAQVPFHTWLPDAMEAPTPISAYLHAAAMVKAAVFVMARLVFEGYRFLPNLHAAFNIGSGTVLVTGHGLGIFMSVTALITMLVGVYLYFAQDDLKRLLAYSTITQLGYMFFGLGLALSGVWLGFLAALIHLVAHGFAKTLLFLATGSIAHRTGTRSISSLGGLARTMPVTAVAFTVGAFALVGIPPLACFWSKFTLLTAIVSMGGAAAVILLVPFALETVVGFFWFVRVCQRVFLGEESAVSASAEEAPALMQAVLVVLIVLCIVGPVLALPFLPVGP